MACSGRPSAASPSMASANAASRSGLYTGAASAQQAIGHQSTVDSVEISPAAAFGLDAAPGPFGRGGNVLHAPAQPYEPWATTVLPERGFQRVRHRHPSVIVQL